MNIRILLIGIVVLTTIVFSSCKKNDDVPYPTVEITELGYENSKIGYTGSDLHIEANVVAEGTIDKITVQIYPIGEKHDSWEIDTTYTEFSDKKNITFHKHVDIPTYAEEGYCNFYFIVTDMDGQETIVADTLEIKLPDDSTAPVISVSEAPSDYQVFANGETIIISGTISDDQALGGLYIGLVRVDQGLSDEDVDASNTITLLHTHDFDNPQEYAFSADITVGATMDNNIDPKEITGDIAWQSANYYIIVKCKDAYGANWTFSQHYPIVINY